LYFAIKLLKDLPTSEDFWTLYLTSKGIKLLPDEIIKSTSALPRVLQKLIDIELPG